MSCKFARLLLATSVAAGLGLSLTESAGAADHGIEATSDPAKCDKQWGPPCFTPGNGTVTKVDAGDTVTWHVTDGTHTVTPVDPNAFQGSGDLNGPDGSYTVTFERPGVFAYYCTHHGSVDPDGKTYHGMWGKIEVAQAPPPTTATTAPPATEPPPTTAPAPPPTEPPPSEAPPSEPPPTEPPPDEAPPPLPPPPVASPAVAHPAPARAPAPAPRRTPSSTAKAPKPEKGQKKAKESTTTTTTQPAAAPLPPFDIGSWSPGPPPDPGEAAPPVSTPPAPPQGNAVAVLDHKPARRGTKALIVTGIGVAALGIGGAAWRFAHRSSKYWPA